MSVEEKRHLGQSLGKLPPDNLSHVIQIIAQKNPSFNAHSDEVEVDIDAQVRCTFFLCNSNLLSPSGILLSSPRGQNVMFHAAL